MAEKMIKKIAKKYDEWVRVFTKQPRLTKEEVSMITNCKTDEESHVFAKAAFLSGYMIGTKDGVR